jgi:hypothetical protein
VEASIRIFRTIFEDYGDPLVDITVPDLRVQMRKGPRAGTTCTVRSRLIHEDGSYATDFEHDGASTFFLELGVLDQQIISEDWIEVIGVLLEARSWEPQFVRAKHEDEGGGPWDGARKCEYCVAPPKGDGEHWMVEHYLPPKCPSIRAETGKHLSVYGRFVVIRWTP